MSSNLPDQDRDDLPFIHYPEGQRSPQLHSSDLPHQSVIETGAPMLPQNRFPNRSRTFNIILGVALVFLSLAIIAGIVFLKHNKENSDTSSYPAGSGPNGSDADDPSGLLQGLPPELQALLNPNQPRIFLDPTACTRSYGYFDLCIGTNKLYGSYFIEVAPDDLDKPFMVSAMFTKGDAESILLHMPAAQVEQNWFAWKYRDDGPGYLDLYKPVYSVRVKDNQSELYASYLQGTYSGWIASFPTKRNETSNKFVIDASEWFMNGFYIFPPNPFIQMRFSSAKAFPKNIDAKIALKITSPMATMVGFSGNLAAEIGFSIAKLPDVPMPTRKADERIGYFSYTFTQIDQASQKHAEQNIIHRWRLEKQQSTSNNHTGRDAPAPVIKPIIYHIDPSVPRKWAPFVKKGVENWKPAFEAAGFKDAIRAVLPTDPEFPQDYDPADIRYSTISWAPSLSQVFALGPHDADPRSGEILNADIVFTHGWIRAWLNEFETLAGGTIDPSLPEAFQASFHLFHSQHKDDSHNDMLHQPNNDHERKLLWRLKTLDRKLQQAMQNVSSPWASFSFQKRYFQWKQDSNKYFAGQRFVDADRVDEDAIRLFRDRILKKKAAAQSSKRPPIELQDDFIGEALIEVVMHEVGHTLGLRHNFHGSANIPWEKLADKEYVEKYGLSSSVMDYHPVLVMADQAKQTRYYTPVVGTYDYKAIQYGYAYENTPDYLDNLARQTVQENLNFGTDEDDPTPEGINPLISTWDFSSTPLDFHENTLVLVKQVVPEAFEKAKKGTYGWFEFTTDFIRGQNIAVRSLQYCTKFLGGRIASRAHPGSSKARPPVAPVDRDTETRALDMILRELDPDTGFFGKDIMKQYSMFLTEETGYCDGMNQDCLSIRSVDPLGYLYSVRGRILRGLAGLVRYNSMRANTWLSTSNGKPSMDAMEIFTRISDLVLKDYQGDAELIASDFRSQWIEGLLMFVNTDTPIFPMIISMAPTIRASVSSELSRIFHVIDAKLKSDTLVKTSESYRNLKGLHIVLRPFE